MMLDLSTIVVYSPKGGDILGYVRNQYEMDVLINKHRKLFGFRNKQDCAIGRMRYKRSIIKGYLYKNIKHSRV